MSPFLARVAPTIAGLAILLAVTPRGVTASDVPLSKRLKDPSASVRKQAALALAEANDAEAIPVLIDLLGELSAEERQPIEDLLTGLAGEWAPLFRGSSADKIARRIRRNVWLAWWLNTDGEALLDVVREHTSAALRQRGERIESEPTPPLPAAAVRLLALRKPAGASAALLAYLPLAEEENRTEDVKKALALLALHAGKIDGDLLHTLDDDSPRIRAVAAEALVRGGGRAGRAAVRKMLREDKPAVRLRIALALAQTGDRDAVPVLIELLAAVPDEQVSEAEEVLYQLAGDTPPKLPAGTDGGDKKKRHEVWAAWWKVNANDIDLSRLGTDALLGYTVICDNFGGRVFEIDRLGKERWSIGDLQIPLDAIVLPGNRVLLAEYRAGRVTERDFKGNILWQKQIAGPVNAQRLPNGHTFIAAEGGPIVEVDRTGKELYSIRKVPGQLLAAYRWPHGDIVCKTADGQCHILDTSGKQLKSFAAGHDAQSTAGLDLRANGHILITRDAAGQVVEFDREGKCLLELKTPIVGCASQSPNGRILVPDYENKRVYEMDRAGKIVWEYKGNGHFIRARRR